MVALLILNTGILLTIAFYFNVHQKIEFAKPTFKLRKTYFTKGRRTGTALVKNFYRIYKYLYVAFL
mgnify:CR=1 FL=1